MRQGLAPKFILFVYLTLLMLPVYWLINLSLRTNSDIMSGMALWPHHPTLAKYVAIFNDPSWVHAFGVSLTYVAINTVISVTVALPAAYAFNRYAFVGDKHLFFWLLTNLMAPAAVFAMPFFQLYYAIGLFDTVWAVALAHCLFNVPLAVWILEGFVGGVPREIDETAAIDGYSFPRFFIRIFLPLIANGVGVTAFFCFMFSWIEELLATTLTSANALPFAAVMSRSYSAAGMDWALLAAAGVLTMIPGAVVIWFVRNHIAKGFALGRVLRGNGLMLAWMAWTWQTALFFCLIGVALVILTLLAVFRPETPRVRHSSVSNDERRSVLRDPDRVSLHLCVLVSVRRGRPLVPARRIGGLRRRDVQVRVTVSRPRAWCATGFRGRK